MDVCVSPHATFYASPMKLVEYMAMQKAVVAPAMENIRDLIDHDRTGLLFEPQDPQALAAAKEAGFDIGRIERDSGGPEVRKTLEESFMLADALGLSGTPSYVIGSNVVIGAVGEAKLKEAINQARCGKATC